MMDKKFVIPILTIPALLATVAFTPISEEKLIEQASPVTNFISRTVQRINISFEYGDMEFSLAEQTVKELPEKIKQDVQNKVKETVNQTIDKTINGAVEKHTTPTAPATQKVTE